MTPSPAFQHPVPLVLASASRARQRMLRDAGLVFESQASDISEDDIKQALLRDGSMDGADLAQILAQAKAEAVSERVRDAVVIGADQTLTFEGDILSKAEDVDAARRLLLAMRGKTHELHAAATLCRDGVLLWQHVETVRMRVRAFSAEFLGHYMAHVGDEILASVGGYQFEGPGVHLFDKVDGDYSAILGLPLLPLLAALRDLEVLET